MSRIKVLDVTLRDGGCVNNFDFGQSYMEKILEAQEHAGIDIIELGYIDEKDGSLSGRTKFKNEKAVRNAFLKEKKSDCSYVAMIDYGKYTLQNLENRREDGIDGIRLAFHKKDVENVVVAGKIILEKGYDLYLQPMITMRYDDEELLDLIKKVNCELKDITAFYIVDSFGEMRENDLSRIFNLVDSNLDNTISIGFHSHNNLQMSYSNAISLLQFQTSRRLIVDSSIMGMGKGAGNLNTELLLEHLNLFYEKNYKLFGLLDVIDKVINQIHSEFYWGYAPEYYLSSVNHCTPSYASHFYDRHMLPIEQVAELLGLIDEEKKISFDRAYAEQLYLKYNAEKTVDDADAVEGLKREFGRKTIVLVAPGKSLLKAKNKIDDYAKKNDAIVIGLNVIEGVKLDYVLITRQELYGEALETGKQIIVTSNVSKGARGNVTVLDYKKWINLDEGTHDSAAVIMLNLLQVCDLQKIVFAGFDGFSADINDNYYDPAMRHPVSSKQAESRNSYYRNLIHSLEEKGISIEFLTKSRYE